MRKLLDWRTVVYFALLITMLAVWVSFMVGLDKTNREWDEVKRVRAEAESLTAKREAKIEEIKRGHNLNCDQVRTAITVGYFLGRCSTPLADYMTNVEAAWDRNLSNQIAEANRMMDKYGP